MIVEVGSYLMRSDGRGSRSLVAPSTMAGLAAGVVLMFTTAMFVKI